MAEHDTLILKVPGEAAGLVVPLAGVERLELYRGRRSDPAAIVGASVAGLALGAGPHGTGVSLGLSLSF